MPIFNESIPSSDDNGWYLQGGGADVWTAGTVVFGNDSGGIGANVAAGFRWTNVTVPASATINSAILRVQARNAVVGTITNIHGKVRGHKGDAPAYAEGTFEPNLNFTPTTAGTDWDPTAWVIDDFYDIDVTAVLQEIVNATWASGNDLALVIFDDGSVDGNSVRMWQFTDGDGADISIDYSSPGGDDLSVNMQEAQIGGSTF